jgi:hypothetical protein
LRAVAHTPTLSPSPLPSAMHCPTVAALLALAAILQGATSVALPIDDGDETADQKVTPSTPPFDVILFWNTVACDANKRDFSNVPGTTRPAPENGGPTLSSRALGIVHLAMYDALAGAELRATDRYLTTFAMPDGRQNVIAAVSAAAHATLSALFPRQSAAGHFNLARSSALANIPFGSVSTAQLRSAQAFGISVGQAHLSNRARDPGTGTVGYTPSTLAGRHRPDPVNPLQGFHAPFYGARSPLFAAPERYGLLPPPPANSTEYLRSLRQVRAKGIDPALMSTLPESMMASKRKAEETLLGIYWAYDGVRNLGTPPRLYNQIVREVAIRRGNSVADNARLFALVNVALADAGILAWDQKYIHDLWRPVLGVRENDPSMGLSAATPGSEVSEDCDSGWLPLGAPASNSNDNNFTPVSRI